MPHKSFRFVAGCLCVLGLLVSWRQDAREELPVTSATPEPGTAKPLKRIVFVCVENANRSQMAEAFARIHGSAKVEPFSAGSRPSGTVNPRAIAAMQELGYDLSRHRSRSLEELAGQEFDVAVTMGCGDDCPFLKARQRFDWQIPDPKHLPPEEFRKVRSLIETKVKELLQSL